MDPESQPSYWRTYFGLFVKAVTGVFSNHVIQGIVGIVCFVTLYQAPFWLSISLIALYAHIAAYQVWLKERKRAESLSNELVATIHDITLFQVPAWTLDQREFQVTFSLTITNRSVRNLTIGSAKLVLGDSGKAVETVPADFILDSSGRLSKQQSPQFPQGIPNKIAFTFGFVFTDLLDTKLRDLAGKPYLLLLTDSYGQELEIGGRLDDGFWTQRKTKNLAQKSIRTIKNKYSDYNPNEW